MIVRVHVCTGRTEEHGEEVAFTRLVGRQDWSLKSTEMLGAESRMGDRVRGKIEMLVGSRPSRVIGREAVLECL